MDSYVGASRPAPRERERYEVGEHVRQSTREASPPSHWCAALRAVSCPVDDPSTSFALANAIYVANHRLQKGDFVDFGVHATENDDDDNRGDIGRGFASRFTAKIDAIAVVRHAGAPKPITLLDTIAMSSSGVDNRLLDTAQHFVMCFNADKALPCEVSRASLVKALRL